MGRYSADTKVSRYNQLVVSDPAFDLLLDGDAFYWLDHFPVLAGKSKRILMWREDSDYIVKLKLYMRSEIPMTMDLYGDPIVTDLGDVVSEPPAYPRNTCPDAFRFPTFKMYMDGEYTSESGRHAGSMRIDIGFQGNVSQDLAILAHNYNGPGGTMIEVKNISEEDGEFNVLLSWYEILETRLKHIPHG